MGASTTVALPGPGATPGPGGAARLDCRDLHVHFAGVRAIDGVDLSFVEGEILGLIGPNGAGKTTLVNALSGFQRPTAGSLALGGRSVTRWSPHRLARHGVTRTFQNIRLFRSMTAAENVEAAALGAGLGPRAARERAVEALGLVGLAGHAGRRADALPYGDERRLGIARALALRPRLLMLDEPAAGLNEVESDALLDTLGRIRALLGCGLLVIEHDMRLIMRLCDRLQVLDHGRTIKIGTPDEVQRDDAVLDAYLGTKRTRNRARR